MTKLKDSAILDEFIHNLSGVYTMPAAVLANPDVLDVELDLGCGKGSFTTELAKRHPERIILAADVLSGRLRKLVKRNQREGVENMRVLKAEARMLVARLLPPPKKSPKISPRSPKPPNPPPKPPPKPAPALGLKLGSTPA